MTREQFESYAAANPEAVQAFVKQGQTAGVADGIKAERARVVAIMDACKANHGLADKAIRSGAEVDQVALAVETSDAAAAENKRLSDELAKAKAQAAHVAGDTPVIGTTKPEAGKPADAKAAAKAEWEGMTEEQRDRWIDEDIFVRVRAREITAGK